MALNGIYTKKAIDMEKMDSVKLTLHVNVNASLLLLVPAFLTGQVGMQAKFCILSKSLGPTLKKLSL